MELDSNKTRLDGLDSYRGAGNFAQKAVSTVKNTADEMTEGTDGVTAGESGEGKLTKQIESITSKIPSGTFLSFAAASIGISAILRLFGNKNDAQFVGQWVPTILLLGLYNKVVKLEGSE